MNDVPRLDSYVRRLASTWDDLTPGRLSRTIDGSLVFMDISGFTRLSERLAAKGRIGAEELTSVLDRVFSEILESALTRGGSLLKFGGDALLLLFDTNDHVMQACAAAVEMRAAARLASTERTSVGRINLDISAGVHTGPIDLFLVGTSHRELLTAGESATVATRMEEAADAGEIVVSASVRSLLPNGYTSEAKGDGWLLKRTRFAQPPAQPVDTVRIADEAIQHLVPLALRAHLTSGAIDAEHRIVTVAFVNFSGVDSVIARSGMDATASELDQLVSVIQSACDAEGVTFLASDVSPNGGKVILATGAPASFHDDEGRLLRAARKILDADLGFEVRIGMNRGHVFAGSVGSATQRTYTLMGDTMNLAARVMGAAPPGMLYVTPEILDLSSSLFHTLAIDPFFVKGKTQLVQAYAVFEEVGVRPPSTVSELPFHGRDGELEFLVSLVTSCSVLGRGSIVTITGETGVGKSRLIAEVLADCPGLSTLRIQAEPNGRENPYWAFRDPLRGMLGIVRTTQADMESQLRQVISDVAPRLEWAIPLLGDVMHISVADTTETAEIDPQFRPERTAASVIELLSTINSEGFAIVVADGQWLDDASLFLLERLGIAAKSRPWTVIVTARSDDHHFAPMGDTIALQPLSDHAIRKIVIEATRAAPLRPHELEAVISRVGGNPLFLTETLRVIRETGYVDTIPETLDAVVSIQIDTLPSLTKQLLRYSSVLGRTFRRVVLDEFLAPESVQFDEATMRELERFIHDDGDERMQFRHAVVHEVAYGGLSFRKRRELHVRAGDVIERLAGDDVDSVAEYLATHYSLSSVANEKVWRYARVAADRARRAYANAEAAAQYGRALEAVAKLREIDASEVADIWARLGAVQDLTGQFEEARKAYGQALRVAGDDPVRISDLHLLRARTWLLSGRPPQARRNISLGRKHLIDAESHEQQMALARLQAYEAHILAAKGDPISAETVARSAAALAMSAGEEEALARAYGVIDWANFMMGRDEPRHGPEAIEIFERLGQLERSVGVKNNMGAFAFLEGEWDEAVEWYRQAVDAAERSGNVVEAARTRANLAEVLVGQRRHAEALPYLEDAERVYLASNAPQGLPFTRMVAARAVAGLGDLDSAIESLDLLFDQQLADGDTSEDPQIVVHLAEVLVRADRPTEALERVERFSTVAPEDAASVSAGIHRVTGMAYAKMGGAAAAITELELALHHALEEEDLLEELLSRETLGQIQTLSGSEPDFEHTARVSTLAERLGVVVSEPAWSS